MSPERAEAYIRQRAEVYAERVRRGYLNQSAVFTLLRADAVHAADSLDGVRWIHQAGIVRFDELTAVTKCSVEGCQNIALDQGRGPSVCAKHDPGR